MPFFVRKILFAKWTKDIEGEITADAVTACLKTYENTLSLWKIDGLVLTELEKCVLAMATSEKVEQLNSMTIFCFDEDFFSSNNLNLSHAPTQGKSYISRLNEFHFDILNLNYSKLKIVGNKIKDEVDNHSTLSKEQLEKKLELRTFTASKVKAIVKSAIESKELDINLLHEKVRALFS